MSDISDFIIKILADNGVSVEQTDIWKDNGLVRNVKSIIELDFSEYDKVFEDKIAEQKNEILMLKALIDNYRDAESKLFDENQELKQRIAELESENEKLFDYLSGITGNTRDEIKNNIGNPKKISKKTIKPHIVIVGKEIDRQTYVKFEDFMSIVNDLQAKINN